MAGSNQAVNLGGMLSQIGGSIGRGIDTTGLQKTLQNTTRPEVNMQDPQSMERYARWAAATGNEREALAMRQRASELQQQQAAMKRQAGVMENAMLGQASAQQGDVQGVETQIANLQQRLKAPGIQPQEQRMIMQQMQQLSSLRPAATKIETQNKIKGATQLETLLANGQLDQQQAVKVQDRLDMLMQDADVASGVNDIKVQQFRQQKELQGMAADKYIADNQARLVAAMDSEDADALSDIIAEAPQGAAGKVQALANSYINLRQIASKWEDEQRDMSTPLDVEGAKKVYAGLPEQFSKPILDAYKYAGDYQKENFKNGQWISEEARSRALKLQTRADSMAAALSIQYAQTEAGRVTREQAETDAQVERLQLARLEPISELEVARRAKRNQKYDKKGDAIPLTPADYQNAESQLRAEREESISEQLRFLTGEEAPEENSSTFDLEFAKQAVADEVPLDVIAKQYGLTVAELKSRLGMEEKEMSFIERVRSKLSPMGTYGGKAPSLSDLANGDR